jgi:hypothetical protein
VHTFNIWKRLRALQKRTAEVSKSGKSPELKFRVTSGKPELLIHPKQKKHLTITDEQRPVVITLNCSKEMIGKMKRACVIGRNLPPEHSDSRLDQKTVPCHTQN